MHIKRNTYVYVSYTWVTTIFLNSSGVLERLSQSFTLNIKHTCAEPEKTYKLNFMGSKTIQEVRNEDLFDSMHVAVHLLMRAMSHNQILLYL